MKLVIIGAGGHGKVVADIAVKCGYREIIFLDDNTLSKICLNFPVVGKIKDVYKYLDYDFFVAIGNTKVREVIQNKLLHKNCKIINLIHPNAVVASDVNLGIGTVVMAGAIINSGTEIGNGCIINTGATVDHDNKIDDYVHISVGSHLAGTVIVGKGTCIGAGAIVSNNLRICKDCMIGAGAVVIKNIEELGVYVGIPARRIK